MKQTEIVSIDGTFVQNDNEFCMYTTDSLLCIINVFLCGWMSLMSIA